MKLSCIIVDDEPLALDILEDYIRRTPSLELAGRFTNSGEALKFLGGETGNGSGGGGGAPIDLIFLDIQMPGLDGLELARSVGGTARVIFTTAFPQYALEGFRVDALDYLLKPISFAEFSRSVRRAEEWCRIKRAAETPSHLTDDAQKTMIVKSNYKQFIIPVETIAYIEGIRDYVRIHIFDAKTGQISSLQTLMNMKTVEEMLSGGCFARIHRSWIVNIDRVVRIQRGRAVLDLPAHGPDDGQTTSPVSLPISDTYKESFLNLLASRAL